jgi:hypothetical protein
LPPRRRRFGTGTCRAISHGNHGSFGTRARRVLGDVGVRFGGSEHHRIETSSSHTRPPALRGRDSRPPGQGSRRPSGHRPAGSTGNGKQARFGAPASPPTRGEANGALRSIARRTSPGQGNPSSSEHGRPRSNRPEFHDLDRGRAPDPPGFGRRRASAHRPPRLRGWEPRALRSTGAPAPPGQGSRRPSAHPPARSSGTGQPARFGTPARQFHRDRATGAPRGTGTPDPPGPGNRRASANRHALPPGQGTSGPSRSSAPHPTGAPQTVRFGASGAAPHRDRATEPLRRTGTPVPTGSGSAPPHRDRATEAPRSPARPNPSGRPRPPGHRKRCASAHRAQRLTGARQTAPFGESGGAPHRGRETRALRSPGTPAPPGQGTRGPSGPTAPQPERVGPPRRPPGPPAPRGRTARTATAGNYRCTSRASARGGRQGNRPRSGPAPGRTVTAGRQRPQ